MRWSRLIEALRDSPLGIPPLYERESRKVVRAEAEALTAVAARAEIVRASVSSAAVVILDLDTTHVSA
jgi:hypothetical protein